MDEVRFDRMVPAQIVKRRNEKNVAFLPVGSLEWHGPHMPFGTDYMTVTHLAEEGARRFGGVAFPPVFYGDVRFILQECRVEWRESYCREMQVPEAFASVFPLQKADGTPGYDFFLAPDDGPPAADPMPFTYEEQKKFFAMLIAKSLLSIHLYGFRNIILLPGHGPNPEFCRMAEGIYRQNVARRKAFGEAARTLTYVYFEAAKESEPLLKNHWIHADKWEGSLTMVAAPGTVHPEYLPRDPKTLVPAYLGTPYIHEREGYNPAYRHIWHSFDALDPRHMDEAYGRAQYEAILKAFGETVRQQTAPEPAAPAPA